MKGQRSWNHGVSWLDLEEVFWTDARSGFLTNQTYSKFFPMLLPCQNNCHILDLDNFFPGHLLHLKYHEFELQKIITNFLPQTSDCSLCYMSHYFLCLFMVRIKVQFSSVCKKNLEHKWQQDYGTSRLR